MAHQGQSLTAELQTAVGKISKLWNFALGNRLCTVLPTC